MTDRITTPALIAKKIGWPVNRVAITMCSLAKRGYLSFLGTNREGEPLYTVTQKGWESTVNKAPEKTT